MNKIKNIVIATVSALAISGVAAANEVDIKDGADTVVSVEAGYVTEYVQNGLSLSRQAIQLNATIEKNGFEAGVFSSNSIGRTSDSSLDEIQLHAQYTLGIFDTVKTTAGVRYYNYPENGEFFGTDDGVTGSYEGYAIAGLDTFLSPKVQVAYDVTLDDLTVEGDISHHVDLLGPFKAEAVLTAGLVSSDDRLDYQYGQANANLVYAINETSELYGGATYAVSTEDTLGFEESISGFTDSDDVLFFGGGLRASF